MNNDYLYQVFIGTAIGVALRNKTLCQGFLFRYSGVSKEDQMKKLIILI